MKERGILFSAPMVRALLDGSKTQTRRVAKVPGDATDVRYWAPPSGRSQPGWADPGLNYWTPDDNGATASNHLDRCPFGESGDQLWVRETWRVCGGREYEYQKDRSQVMYRATHQEDGFPLTWESYDWRPSIFMFRWASRITLEITAIRVERLHEISEADCIAEGAPGGHGSIPGYPYSATPLEHYHYIWEQINGTSSWDANPWVWVVEFKRITPQGGDKP